MEDFNLWQKFINSNYGKRATLPIQYLLGNRDNAEQFMEEDMGRFGELLLSTTKPFRTGANILAQNYGSAFTGQDMSQSENQGGFLKWLAGGITPEEQDYINRKPYMAAIKSGAGIASTFLPFASRGVAATTLLPRALQVAGRGLIEGLPAGLAYSREGKELQDTAVGGVMGAGGELLGEILTNPSFRKMLTDASTYVDPSTGGRMYRGSLGDDDISFNNDIIKVKETPRDLGSDIENLAEFTDSNNPGNGREFINIDAEDVKYPTVDIPDDFEITNYQDYDNPIANLETEAKKYATPDEFVKAQGETLYHGTSADFEPSDFKGGYLTGDKNYAEVYKNPSASSISYGEAGIKNKKSGQPRVLEYFVDKDANIFDYTNPKHRNLLNDYFGDWSMSGNPVVGKSGQLDWTEGENLIEFFDEKGIKFDGIKLDEGGGFDPETRIELKRAPSVRIINPKVLKTKSQLTDIWNKAHNLKDSAKELRGGFEEILKKSGIK